MLYLQYNPQNKNCKQKKQSSNKYNKYKYNIYLKNINCLLLPQKFYPQTYTQVYPQTYTQVYAQTYTQVYAQTYPQTPEREGISFFVNKPGVQFKLKISGYIVMLRDVCLNNGVIVSIVLL